MYILNEKGYLKIKPYVQKEVAKTIGISENKISAIKNKKESCIKLTAYAITKFLDTESEILDFFELVERV